MTKKVLILLAILVILLFSLTACMDSDANVASRNLSREADQFQILRRIVFYNGITGDYILVLEGFCSLGNFDPDGELSVTCKTGQNEYKKHFLGLSDNVTYFAEQLNSFGVSVDHYLVIFKPSTIIPDIEIE